ncbi:NADH-quinone oxidoreductase subunit A [Intestinicryptomonas porci]|uniref:NADH-quinone oxidoreductase subunit n=1 Tax=Intestinicryptomonas porci TaxID=2926320 RepID=A0ABU4WEZ1_9BACT|nr:NADH-quinone oxidoreductase subunit A [Opitutales bacterium CLA-KB-P66]
MEISDYIPVLIQIVLALAVGFGIIAASHIFGQRSKKNAVKDSAYECGIKPLAKPHPRFGVKFYVVAMLFVVFDIEAVFILPLALVYREFIAANIALILPVMFFVALIAAGIFYEIKKDALDWNIPKTNR